MTLNELVLQKLAEWRPTGNGRQSLIIPDEETGWTVNLTANRHDDLGCLAWEMILRRTAIAEDVNVSLSSWAEEIAERVTSLLEPLRVVEVDLARNEALLRSEKPTPRGEAVLYYEVHLKGTQEAVLRRYQGFHETSKHRAQIAFPMVHEALIRVIREITGAQ